MVRFKQKIPSASNKSQVSSNEPFYLKVAKSDLRVKVGITVFLIVLYRVGVVFPAPGVDYVSVKGCIDYVSGDSFYEFVALFGGGSIFQLGLFALGVIPYITASIVIQLLSVVVPKIAALKRDGQSGQSVINQYTRYLTVALALLQAVSITVLARTPGALFQGCPDPLLANNSLVNSAVMVASLVAGAMIVMWFGEVITERGIGNGASLIIFSSIAAAIPAQILSLTQSKGASAFAVFVAVAVIIIAFVVFVEQGQRRIPVHYQTQLLSQRISHASTYLPLKITPSGVVPIIFASALTSFPLIIVAITQSDAAWAVWVNTNLVPSATVYYVGFYAIFVMFFNYFYSAIVVNPYDIAEDLNKDGGFIPGVRAGDETAKYLSAVLNRLIFPGSIYLAFIALLPIVLFSNAGFTQAFIYSGISVLILVSVALDTSKRFRAENKQIKNPSLFRESLVNDNDSLIQGEDEIVDGGNRNVLSKKGNQ